MRVGKLATLRGEAVEVGRFHMPGTIASEIPVADVIGEDKDDRKREKGSDLINMKLTGF